MPAPSGAPRRRGSRRQACQAAAAAAAAAEQHQQQQQPRPPLEDEQQGQALLAALSSTSSYGQLAALVRSQPGPLLHSPLVVYSLLHAVALRDTIADERLGTGSLASEEAVLAQLALVSGLQRRQRRSLQQQSLALARACCAWRATCTAAAMHGSQSPPPTRCCFAHAPG